MCGRKGSEDAERAFNETFKGLAPLSSGWLLMWCLVAALQPGGGHVGRSYCCSCLAAMLLGEKEDVTAHAQVRCLA